MAPYLGCVKKRCMGSNAGIITKKFYASCPIDPMLAWVVNWGEVHPALPSLKVSVMTAREAEQEERQHADRLRIAGKKFRDVFFNATNDKFTGKFLRMCGFGASEKDRNGVYFPLIAVNVSDRSCTTVFFRNTVSNFLLRTLQWRS